MTRDSDLIDIEGQKSLGDYFSPRKACIYEGHSRQYVQPASGLTCVHRKRQRVSVKMCGFSSNNLRLKWEHGIILCMFLARDAIRLFVKSLAVQFMLYFQAKKKMHRIVISNLLSSCDIAKKANPFLC